MGSEPLSRAFLFRYSVEDIVFWALCAAYFVIMTAVSGATLGKKAMGLKVVTPEGEKPSFLTVLSRETWARYLSSLLYIGYILCLADPENGALHDRIAGTLVVARPTPPAAVAALNGRPAPHERDVRPSGSGRT